MLNRMKSSGFTIVELAIVIVVIAILAIVTIASFDSVQRHAHESVTASNVEMYVGALEQVYQDTGEYPETFGFEFACLGPRTSSSCSSGTLSYSGAGCPAEGIALGGDYETSEAINTQLLKYLDELPDGATLSSVKNVQTVQTDSGPCSVIYQTDGSLLYSSGVYATRKQDGGTSFTYRIGSGPANRNVGAYKLEYVLPGDAECYGGGAKKTYVQAFDVTGCNVYGGDIRYE